MRKFLISIALVSTALTAAPAVAQHRGDHGRPGWHQPGPNRNAVNQLLRDLNRVEQRIQRSAQRRIISQREALSLRREANQIRNRLHRSGRNGLTGREFADLRVRVNRLEQRLRVERRDNDGRRW